MLMQVDIHDQQSDLSLDHDAIQRAAEAVLALEQVRTDSIEVYFVDKTEIGRIHGQHFDDPSPTDCMSFPVDAPGEEAKPHMLGSVFVCPKVAQEWVEEHSGNAHTETLLYLVHALLHLIGYDDIDEGDRKLMRDAEARHMSHLDLIGIRLG